MSAFRCGGRNGRRCTSRRCCGVFAFLLGSGACATGGGTTATTTDPVTFPDERPPASGSTSPPATDAVREAEEHLAEGRVAEAKGLLEDAIATNSEDARAWFDLGLAQEMDQETGEAEASYRTAVRLERAFPAALNNLGLLLRSQERVDEALEFLRRAADLSPRDPATLTNFALALEESGNTSEARTAYERAVNAAPEDGRIRANYGLLLLSLGEVDAAARELVRALSRTSEDDVPSLLALGNGLRRAGRASEALVAMRRAVAAADDRATPALLSELALAERAAGERPAAEATLARALSLDADYATAHYLLANMQAGRGAFADAIRHYRRYLALEPNGAHADTARERLERARQAANLRR